MAAAVPELNIVGTAGPRTLSKDFHVGGAVDSTGRRWVVRCPLNDAAGAALEAEVPVLHMLARKVDDGSLPFTVPRPAGMAVLPEGGRALVWPWFPGLPLDLGELGPGPGLSAELGRAIAALHELDPRLVEEAGLPVYDAQTYRTRCLAEVDEAARTGHVPPSLLTRWERALEDVALWRFRAVPVHGDLAPENVLVHGGRIVGMYDFTSMHVGDPAQDLAWLLASAPLESLDAIEEAYNLARTETPDAALLDRAMLVSELAVARWLLHGTRLGEQPVVDDAVRMLQELADQVAGEPPIGQREPVVVPDWTPVSESAPTQPSAADVPEDADAYLDDAAGAQPAVPADAESTAASSAEAGDVDTDATTDLHLPDSLREERPPAR